MKVVNRKRFSIMLCCILIGIFSFFYSYEVTRDEEEKQQVQVSATPVSGKVVILDAGHRCTR